MSADEERVVGALASIGVSIGSVFDLLSMHGVLDKKAIRLLLDLLPEISDQRTKEGIVRALTTIDARGTGVIAVLIGELHKLGPHFEPSSQSLGWALGNAISVISRLRDQSNFKELVELVEDRRLGTARQMLTEAIAKTRHPDAATTLLNCLADEQLTGHAIFALGQLRAVEAQGAIEPYLNHKNKWFRKEARRALAKIDKVAGAE